MEPLNGIWAYFADIPINLSLYKERGWAPNFFEKSHFYDIIMLYSFKMTQ
jgi:hypothetical protein